ncbi:MAG TPA: LysR family transcriptional regulator [Devosiaceae bacterium]|jgi:DNA-binding transcriptional LysR family regulator
MFDKRYHKAMARLRFRQLQLVSVLGRTHNLNAAAKQLVMTQPAATKMLQEVEDIVGSPLFERLPRGMRPTEIGQVATLYAHRAIDEAVKFLDDSRVLREGGQGVLHIGAIMASVEHLLPAAMAELRRLRPKLTMRLLTGTSDQLVIALLQNRVELVVGRPSEMTSYATSFMPLMEEEVWAFAAADHPLAGVKGLKPADVADEAWVLQPITSPLRLVIDRLFATSGRSVQSLVETTSVYATLRLVHHVGMISVLPAVLLESRIASGAYVRLDIDLKSDLGPYGIITRANEDLSTAAMQLIEMLQRLATPSQLLAEERL